MPCSFRLRAATRGLAAGVAAFLLTGSTLGRAASTTNVAFGGATTSQYTFRPPVVTIHPGDTVIWSNNGGTHTVTGSGSDVICGSGTIATSCSHTFNAAGDYPYACLFHGGSPFFMTGIVHVASVALPAPPVLTNAVVLTNKQFRFTVLTTASHTNVVRAYTNLSFPSNWVVVATVVPTSNSFTFTDSNAPNFGIRIYRVVEQ